MSAATHTHVFVAVQTSGPDENQDEILDLAIVAADGATILHTAFLPGSDTELPEELGYSPGDLAPSPLFVQTAQRILAELAAVTIVGHDPQLAMRFIRRQLRLAFAEEDKEEVDEMLARISSPYIDTVTLAWEQLPALNDRSLEAVCAYLRIPYRAHHSALEDARAARIVQRTLVRGTALKRWWWAWKAPT